MQKTIQRYGKNKKLISMVFFIIKRLAQSIPVLLGAITLSFVLLYIIPGDPVLSIVGEYYNEETITNLREELNLDKNLWTQYYLYLFNVISGNLGNSYITGEEVFHNIIQRLPYTIILAIIAMLFATTLGISLGLIASINHNTIIDRIIVMFSIFTVSSPVFWIALLIILLFSLQLRLLPPSGYDGMIFIILPALTLGMRSIALFIRITRTNFIEILNKEYMITAKAKGLSKNKIIYKHGFKNLLIPIITIIGLDFGSYLTGAVLTESIFGWPGIGRMMLNAIMQRDFPLIQGGIIYMVLIFIIINIIIDILYVIINPKIRDKILYGQ